MSFFMVSCSDDSDDRPAGASRPTMNKQDSLAMVAFYHSMKCAEWTGGFRWNLNDISTWGGVTFTLDEVKNEWRVSKIETPYASLYIPASYSLPPELGNLTKLEELRVWGDSKAVGGIPPEIFNCPLKVLIIGDCNSPHGGFNGTLPKEIGKVAGTLENLMIVNTSIGGDIPEEVGTLSKLKYAATLRGNNFTGKVPIFLRDLPHGATVRNNYFTEMDWRYYTEDIGEIPDVTRNHLHGDIPSDVLQTERWKIYNQRVKNQADGYGYNEKYFK